VKQKGRPPKRGPLRVRLRCACLVCAGAGGTFLGGSFLAGCATAPGLSGGAAVTTVASASRATVDVRDIAGVGRVLVTSSGTTLYLLTADPPGGTNCTGSCAIVWPPFEVRGKLKAGPGVNPSLLSSFERPGGASQVRYDGHALYTFEQDTGPGMVRGQGVETYGGTWWVASPDGRAVTGH